MQASIPTKLQALDPRWWQRKRNAVFTFLPSLRGRMKNTSVMQFDSRNGKRITIAGSSVLHVLEKAEIFERDMAIQVFDDILK